MTQLYCHVTNGAVDEGPGELPQHSGNVTRIDLLDAAALAALGWYAIIANAAPSFDAATQKLTQWLTVDDTAKTVTQSFTVVALSADELAAIAASNAADLKAQALAALDDSDTVAIRCFKANVAFPSEWQTYVVALRVVASSGAGPMPAKPSYPAGT